MQLRTTRAAAIDADTELQPLKASENADSFHPAGSSGEQRRFLGATVAER